MNLYSHSDLPALEKALIFGAVFIPTTALALYTVIISRRIANFMEALSSEGLTWGEKVGTFRQIFSVTRRDRVRARRENHGLTGPD
jgi:hypothetical protein